MKKSLIVKMLCIVVTFVCACMFVACGEQKPSTPETSTVPSLPVSVYPSSTPTTSPSAEITSDLFTITGNTLSATVPYTYEYINFLEEIQVQSGTVFNVYMDLEGQQPIPTFAANLSVGENVFYITVTSGAGTPVLYFVNIIRLPMVIPSVAPSIVPSVTPSVLPSVNLTNIIKIGASGPLTGGAAIYGQAVYNGAKLAVDEINAAGGLDGMMFSFDMYDDRHDPTKVEVGYYDLVDNKGMQISLGCVTTRPLLEFKNLAAEDNMFIMTPSATGDDVYKNAPNVYQMCFSDNGQGTGSAAYVAANYANAKIGVFYKFGDDYSAGIYENFKAAYPQAKWADVKVASFTEETNSDFSAQIQILNDCEFIFMPIYYQEASLFMQQAQGIIADDAIFFGCDGFDGINTYLGNQLDDIKQEISYLSHFDSSATTGKAGAFVTKYTQTYGIETLNQFGSSAYDCVYAIFEALKVAKENGKIFDGSTKPSDMCTILTEVLQNGTFSFSGATGSNIRWNANGTVNKLPVKYVVKAAIRYN